MRILSTSAATIAAAILAAIGLPAVASGQHLAFAKMGATAAEGYGSAIARVHDFDLDGFDDLAIGAEGFDAGAFSDAGKVDVISGKDGVLLASTPGSGAIERLGASVLGVADLNGDGVPEIAAGAPGFGGANPRGAIRILHGASLAPIGIIVGPSAGARIGEHLSRLGDLTGDGKPEVVTGARGLTNGPIISGGAAIVYDVQTGLVFRTWFGQSSFESFGADVAAIPDMNGDGQPDVVVGAPGADPLGMNGAGSIVVADPVTGSPIATFDGIAANEGLGSTCDGIADLDGDLIPDVLGGAPGAAPLGIALAGSVYVFSGGNGHVLQRFDGMTVGDQLGTALAALDDIDLDGVADLAVGSPSWSLPGKPSIGRVTIHSGSTFSLLYRFEGISSGAELGSSACAIGDLNEDSRPDFAIGWKSYNGAAQDIGSVRIHYGQFPSLTVSTTGQFGAPVDLLVQSSPQHGIFLLVDVASGAIQTPFGTACVGLTPALQVLFAGVTSTEGLLLWSGTIPAIGLPPGATFWIQPALLEPNSFGGGWLGNCRSVTVVP